MKRTRKNHTPAFKAKVALAALREHESIPELSKRYGVHANQIYKWKREFIERATLAFEPGGAAVSSGSTEREEELLKKIGELTMERDFLVQGLERRR
jgi:transposase